MNPTDLSWWWEHGLDGVIGGLIGAAVTAVAVLVTLRHEQRQARLAALSQDVARLAGVAISFAQDVNARRSDTSPADLRERWWEQAKEVQALSFQVEARAARDWPRLAAEISNDRLAFTTSQSPSDLPPLERQQRIASALAAIGATCTI